MISTSQGRYRLNKVVKQFFSCYLCCDRAAAEISSNVGRKNLFLLQELMVEAKVGIGLTAPVMTISGGRKIEFDYLHCPVDLFLSFPWDSGNHLSL